MVKHDIKILVLFLVKNYVDTKTLFVKLQYLKITNNCTFRQCSSFLDLKLDDSVFLDEPGAGDDLVAGDVSQNGPEGPVTVWVGTRGVALAQAVRAVPKHPAPPAVNFDLVWKKIKGKKNHKSNDRNLTKNWNKISWKENVLKILVLISNKSNQFLISTTFCLLSFFVFWCDSKAVFSNSNQNLFFFNGFT